MRICGDFNAKSINLSEFYNIINDRLMTYKRIVLNKSRESTTTHVLINQNLFSNKDLPFSIQIREMEAFLDILQMIMNKYNIL